MNSPLLVTKLSCTTVELKKVLQQYAYELERCCQPDETSTKPEEISHKYNIDTDDIKIAKCSCGFFSKWLPK